MGSRDTRATATGWPRRLSRMRNALGFLLLAGVTVGLPEPVAQLDRQRGARDPGVRGDPPGAGGPLAGLAEAELALFEVAREIFQEVQSVSGGLSDGDRETEAGLGPRFNLDSCTGCHMHPAVGGSSPPVNPQVAVATKAGAANRIPFFIGPDGPVREARLKFRRDGSRDGGVLALFTIAGRSDAPGCAAPQPDFEAQRGNLAFRIPTPLFGTGLIEAIDDATIQATQRADLAAKRALGIGGRPNLSANDGTITRFGWKAQNKSLELFSGEAYNVEQGVTNDLFPQERDRTPGCEFNPTPESTAHPEAATPVEALSDVQKFTMFMRFLAPPTPVADTPSIQRGRVAFTTIGCALCHTPSLTTGNATSAALRGQPVRLYSDLLLHRMGAGLTDDVVQGVAGPDEFRTAPLWGLGQRLFFLHDGRTRDLREAIDAHASRGSEANQVIDRFRGLPESTMQDLLNFLRAL